MVGLVRVRVVVATAFALLMGSACVGDDAPDDPYDLGKAKAGSGGASGKGTSKAGTGAITAGTGATSMMAAAGSKLSHYPLVVGSTWTYHHENPTKQPWDEVDALEATTYMGIDGVILTDEEDAQGEQTRSTLVVQGTGVFRAYKEVAVAGNVAVKTSYDPGFLRYDEAWTVVGQTMTLDDDWVQTCVFTSSAAKCAPGAVKPGKTTHIYEVAEVSAMITVPAGTFQTVKIKRTNPGDSETKLFWFAAGVGKVREEDTSSGAIEELTAYDIP